MTTDTEAREIARGLTKAQREALAEAMTEDTTSPRRRAAVEAAAKELVRATAMVPWDALTDDQKRAFTMATARIVAPYEDGMGRTLDAKQLRGMADDRA
jgi:hypothetical protein